MPPEAATATTVIDVPEISRDDFKRGLKAHSFKVVDVLPSESYANGHIPGALSVPVAEIAALAPRLLPDLNEPIVAYCGKFTWHLAEQAVSLLHELGYTNVRDYRGGLADWIESGGTLEALDASVPAGPAPFEGPALTDGQFGRAQARIVQHRRDSVLGLVDSMSTSQLFLIWLLMILLSGFGYWLAAIIGEHGLVEGGSPVGTDLKGFADAIYFSFVTATSVGYGDVLPVGIARGIAVAEAITALLIFGAVIAKFVSHRQDELVGEIHRITFDERLDRVQSNLHTVISELLDLTTICEGTPLPPNRLGARLDSIVLMFQSEARTTHDLLYQPRLMVEEGVLASILANFSSALEVLAELLTCLPTEFRRSQPFQIALSNTIRLADDICSNCVPHEYTPRLRFWMDRIQATARKIH